MKHLQKCEYAQYVPWTDNGRSFHHSTEGFQAAKRRIMDIRLESLQGASYLRSQLCQIVNDASCCLAGATKYAQHQNCTNDNGYSHTLIYALLINLTLKTSQEFKLQ
ncbi:hypothetical protein BCV71DRAFT_240026 [Rhizopus microsporus]|uniref:Uncharacterized protein n=1 Tax=Rhizopus microsporus TaxID=58291 RepID=A0A1X0RKN5_RHIZD|nr:hypothetical protein BCV71DRAFT_240026 [Rhizopus microsporus]